MDKPGEFDLSGLGPSAEDYALAAQWLGEGTRFPELEHRLQGRGLRTEFVWMAIEAAAGKWIEPQVVAGVGSEKLTARLIDQGLSEERAQKLLDSVRNRHRRRLGRTGLPSGPWARLGTLVFVLGVGVWIACATGLLPAPAVLGGIIMLLGGAVALLGLRS